MQMHQHQAIQDVSVKHGCLYFLYFDDFHESKDMQHLDATNVIAAPEGLSCILAMDIVNVST